MTALESKSRDAAEPIADTAGDGAAGTGPPDPGSKPEPKVDDESVSDPVHAKGGSGEESEDHGVGIEVTEIRARQELGPDSHYTMQYIPGSPGFHHPLPWGTWPKQEGLPPDFCGWRGW